VSKLLRGLRGQAVAICALCLALGGTSYAAAVITGKNVKNNSLTSTDIKDHSLKGKDFARGTLKRGARGPAGPRGLQGPSGTASPDACPAGTDAVGGGCIETTARAAADYNAASTTCGARGLPNVSQLISFVSSHPGLTGTEWTSDVLDLAPAVEIAVVDISNGLASESANAPHPYRCFTTPIN
jgi:hypothetical protein